MNLELQAYAKEADLIEQHQFAFVKNSSSTIASEQSIRGNWLLTKGKGLHVLFLTFKKHLR